MLELDEGKLSRPVLRRGGESNLASLSRPYMDPPRFARTMSCDSSQDHDCTHIYGLFCGRHGSPGLDGFRALPPQQFAQFLAVCSSSILAETLGYAASFSSALHGKWRVLERHKPLLTDQLQLSTNSDKLSEYSYLVCKRLITLVL
jgi:hypothetical protein